jgi:hypothetical protein
MKVFRLKTYLKLNKLRKGPICNYKKLDRGLKLKVCGVKNVKTEELKGLCVIYWVEL